MICLDTNAVIALINATSTRLRHRLALERTRGEVVGVSAVVLFELWYSAKKSVNPKESSDVIKGFVVGPVSMLAFDSDDAEEAGAIRADLERKGTPIGPYDILIAAQARRRDALLVTANTREFARVTGLRCQNWSADG
jgi:tRNA(fMet)-specific endonuclease VapC